MTIGKLKQDDKLMLLPAPNGGWVVSVRVHPNAEGAVIGAYSSAKDMLDALSRALIMEWDNAND